MEDSNKKDRKGFKLFILILFFAIVIFFSKNHIDKLVPIKDNKTLQVVYKIPANEDTLVKFYKNVFVKYDGYAIEGINRDGTTNWKKEVNFDKPIVYLGEELVYFSEGTTGDIYFLDQGGNSLKRIQLDRPIDNVIEREGIVYVLGKEEDMDNITILDNQGEILSSISTTGTILNFALNNEKTEILISTMNIGEDNIVSKLNSYDIKGKVLGSLTFKDEIITFVDFIDEGKLLILTDCGFYSAKDSNILCRKNYSCIKDICINSEEKSAYLLFDKGLELISYDGKVKNKIELDSNYNTIFPYKRGVIVVGDKEVLGFERGKEYLRYSLEEEGKVIIDGLNIVQVTSDKINVMKVINENRCGG